MTPATESCRAAVLAGLGTCCDPRREPGGAAAMLRRLGSASSRVSPFLPYPEHGNPALGFAQWCG